MWLCISPGCGAKTHAGEGKVRAVITLLWFLSLALHHHHHDLRLPSKYCAFYLQRETGKAGQDLKIQARRTISKPCLHGVSVSLMESPPRRSSPTQEPAHSRLFLLLAPIFSNLKFLCYKYIVVTISQGLEIRKQENLTAQTVPWCNHSHFSVRLCSLSTTYLWMWGLVVFFFFTFIIIFRASVFSC